MVSAFMLHGSNHAGHVVADGDSARRTGRLGRPDEGSEDSQAPANAGSPVACAKFGRGDFLVACRADRHTYHLARRHGNQCPDAEAAFERGATAGRV